MKKSLLHSAMIALMVSCALSGCKKSGGDPGDGPSNAGDITVVDGKVRFYLPEANTPLRVKLGAESHKWSSGDKLRINSSRYDVLFDDKNQAYVEVNEATDKIYKAGYYVSTRYFTTSCFRDVIIPHSQFYNGAPLFNAAKKQFPLYATYDKSTGAKLVFNDACGVLAVRIKGDAAISSIKVEDPAGGAMAGFFDFDEAAGSLKPQSSHKTYVDFITLNCAGSGEGVALGGAEKTFYIMLAPRTYSQGLRITVTDTGHKAVVYQQPALTVEPNQIANTQVIDYKPENGLVYFESFDKLVWGGDIMGGENTLALAPTADKIEINGGTSRIGSDEALTKTTYDNPGSGFIQPNTWTSGVDVMNNMQMSKWYVLSRGFNDWQYLFRAQEYQGYLAIGANTNARGVVQTGPMKNFTGTGNIEVSFKFCFAAGANDDIEFKLVNCGAITKCVIDGAEKQLNDNDCSYLANTSSYFIRSAAVGVPSSDAEAKQWHTATITAEQASTATAFLWQGASVNTGNHAFYIDDIVARQTSTVQRKANTLRVLYWNIQNGMWSDQGNNYDNFVKWVKEYDPDVCVWCEAQTIYKNGTNAACAVADRYLTDNWGQLAARYGHNYWQKGGHRDNYPQVITSKLPIEKLQAITDQYETVVSHGAGHFKINFDGNAINFVTLHTWPQAYAFGVSSADQAASAAENGGDKYRLAEMKCIVGQTVNNPTYASENLWLMMGDFNSRSPIDNWYFGYPEDSPVLYVHTWLRSNSTMKDIIAETYPGRVMSSTMGYARIDYMYASPAMMSHVDYAIIVVDGFTAGKQDSSISNFYHPSDHRPILVDFDMKK